MQGQEGMSDNTEAGIRGALAGWRREPSESGVVLRIKLVNSLEAYHSQKFERVDISLNDRQLRSFARDLSRALSERGLELEAAPPRRSPLASLTRVFRRPRPANAS